MNIEDLIKHMPDYTPAATRVISAAKTMNHNDAMQETLGLLEGVWVSTGCVAKAERIEQLETALKCLLEARQIKGAKGENNSEYKRLKKLGWKLAENAMKETINN